MIDEVEFEIFAFVFARFEVLTREAHQPFQEAPDEWNARVAAFWHETQTTNPITEEDPR